MDDDLTGLFDIDLRWPSTFLWLLFGLVLFGIRVVAVVEFHLLIKVNPIDCLVTAKVTLGVFAQHWLHTLIRILLASDRCEVEHMVYSFVLLLA